MTNKVMDTGASTKEAVNTIAQGMSVDPAKPVVTAACFFCCRRAMGEAITRHSLRPLSFFEGTVGWINSDASAPREGERAPSRLFK